MVKDIGLRGAGRDVEATSSPHRALPVWVMKGRGNETTECFCTENKLAWWKIKKKKILNNYAVLLVSTTFHRPQSQEVKGYNS